LRYFVDFSYHGASYHGWQAQPNASSVQETLAQAFSLLLATPISLMGAGRTDAGVHAKKMVAHFDSPLSVDKEHLVARLNGFLPPSIAIKNIREVKETAHARFDATSRTYEYWVHTKKDPFLETTSHYVHAPLDLLAMNAAAAQLLEHTDFECFSKSNSDVHTFLCNLYHAQWEQKGTQLIFTISANRFLRNMVRAIVGTLLEIGMGKTTPADLEKILASKSRSEAGPSVPAKGLYLTEITYPNTIYV
jgi:tRNA pseudouridine38-40 synthase